MRFPSLLIIGFFTLCQPLVGQGFESTPNQGLAEQYYNIGLNVENLDSDEAISAFRKSRDYAIKDGLYKEQIRAEYMLSECFQDNGQIDSALLYINLALKELDSNQVPQHYPSMIYGTKGNIFAQMANYDSALFYHEKALKHLAYDDSEGLAYELMNYGSVLFYLGETERAKQHHNKALKIALEHNYEDLISKIAHDRILLEYEINKEISQGEIDTLLRFSEKADGLAKVVLLQNVALILIQENDLEKVQPLLEQLNQLDTNLGPGLESINTYISGVYFQKINEPKKAIAFLRAFNKYPKSQKTVHAMRRMGELFTVLGEADSSKYYYDKAWELNGKRASDEVKEYFIRSQSFLSVLETKSELAQSEINSLLLQDKIKQQRWWIVVSVLILVLMLLVLIMFRKELSKRRRLKALELANHKARITDMGLRLSQKNELIKELEVQFAKENLGQDEKLTKWKDEVRNNLRKAMNTNKDWENLTHYFEDQYAGFYTKLKSDHPTLTDKELRLCTLAKMRMSVKEMAKVLGLSFESVKSNRYRLRKKLGVEKDVTLSDYLSTYN
jgi:tetratricopeptide (TPR) repeat protein/DNA-binding CsgD family transcriptional regulator